MSSSKPGSSLPPGFRFHPTDEELIRHYLKRKSTSASYPMSIIAEVDIYKFDPWDLPAKAMFGEKEWYFFSPRDRKYPKGARPNRTAASGYWKATGTDKPILDLKEGDKYIGVKKALVFYVGRPPKGIKTNWIMHEYRLSEGPNMKPKPNDSSMRLDDWVLCRIYKKYHANQTAPSEEQEQEQEEPLVQAEFSHQLSILPHHSNQHTLIKSQKSCSFSDLLDAIDNSTLTRFLSDNPYESFGSESGSIFHYGADPNQSSYNNSTKSNSYLINQKLPDYYHQIGSSPSVLAMDNNNNQLKRQHSSMVVTNLDEDMFMLHPTKKSVMMSSCSGGTNKNLDTLNQCQLHNQYY